MTAGKHAQCNRICGINLAVGRLNFCECLIAAERVVAESVVIADFEIQRARPHPLRQIREEIICRVGQLVKLGQERLARPAFDPSGLNQLRFIAQISRQDARRARAGCCFGLPAMTLPHDIP